MRITLQSGRAEYRFTMIAKINEAARRATLAFDRAEANNATGVFSRHAIADARIFIPQGGYRAHNT